jgi:general secretion pathway protein F
VPQFAYRAVDAAGKRYRGNLEAVNPAALSRALEARGLLVLDADEAASGASSTAGFGFGRSRAVLELTRALAALLPAGVPLSRALGTASQVVSGEVAVATTAVRERVERGQSLAAALAEHPHLFPPIYVGLVRAGEKSGDLDSTFGRLAEQLEREEQLRGRLISASVYPLLLVGIGGVAVVVLMLFVLPRFVELLGGAGASLPGSTALLLRISTLLQLLWPLLLLLPFVAAALAMLAAATVRGRRIGAQLLLLIPGIGRLRRAVLAGRFARLVEVLLGGGAPLLTALEDAEQSIGDPLARDDLARIRGRVREGASLSGAIAEGFLFPPLLAQLAAVGEDAGRLREFLLEAANIFEHMTARILQRLVTLLEPTMILVFGGIVAFVALSLLQAIYAVNADAFR